MCIKILCYSTETFLRNYVQRGNPGKNIHVISTSRIGHIPKKLEFSAMYQKMISMGTYWDGPRNYVNWSLQP